MMEFNKFLEYLGLTASIGAIAFGLIKYFSKNIFETYLLKRIESHKSELEKLNIAYQIQFSSLHAKRAEIIKELYYYLYDYKMCVMDFFDDELNSKNPVDHLKHKLKTWTDSELFFNDTFHKNKIFFSAKDSDLINTIHNKMAEINHRTCDFMETFKTAQQQIDSINNKSPEFLKLKKESDQLLDKIFELEVDLENQFRNLLGVEIKK